MRVPELDFKGNPKLVDRVLAKDYKNNLDWSALAAQPDYAAIQAAANPALEIGEVFTAYSQYDALNRPTLVTLPDGTVILPTYNEANFLASLQAKIRGQGSFIDFLKEQDYDAKGQRQFAHYGNELFTRYFYDPNTFRLNNLLTYKSGEDPDTEGLQNLRYTYDPVGNITQIRDDAQQTHYFNNAVVRPESLYEYDAIYQLIRATGREHAGLGNDAQCTHTDLDFIPQLPHANNTAAVRMYTEEYDYDLLGNIKVLKHHFQSQPGIGNGWTLKYRYAFEDNPANCTNRLTSTSLPGDPDVGPYSATYDYDLYGNMSRLFTPTANELVWNFMDQLQKVDLGGGGTAYYVYDIGGQRIRKVIERQGNTRSERIYLGAVEIYRQGQGNNYPHLERYTLHISDNTGYIAQVDTKTRDDNDSDPANPLNVALIRYQYANHLGSAVLETDENGNPISYEEYHPYGTTAYRSAKPGFDLSLKRYRFSGKERDDESGLYYFGARYYAPWLGRWTSSDPSGFMDGLNLFVYCGNSPTGCSDPTGTQTQENDDITVVKPGDYTGTESQDDIRAQYFQENIIYSGNAAWDEEKRIWVVDRSQLIEPKEITYSEEQVTPTVDSQANIDNPPSEETLTPTPESSDSPAEGSETSSTHTASSLRQVLQYMNRPSNVAGGVAEGKLHMWSNVGEAPARKAVSANPARNWMMGDINGSPTPEHLDAELEEMGAKARAARGGYRYEPPEREGIWGPRSAKVVGRAAGSMMEIGSHGNVTSQNIQGKFELPAVRRWGLVGGGLAIGTGLYSAISGGQSNNPFVAVGSVTAGVTEATGGIMYAAGAYGASGLAMTIGSRVAIVGGGVGAIIAGVARLPGDYKANDKPAIAADLLSIVGGVAMIAALVITGPIGVVIGFVGLAMVATSTGFHFGRWLRGKLGH